LRLEQTQDIIAGVSGLKGKRPKLVVGFAAESHDLLANGKKKLAAKKLDLIVANDISQPEAGFGSDANAVTLLFPGGRQKALPRQSKMDLADEILDTIRLLLKKA
jgi:phosphopantothenoylcysteine decarboxylase/phosphopantothenate--cysteine ligase